MTNEAIIISDIHLGSDICRSSELLDFLDNINTEKLIINGDLFDNWDFRRLRKEHWKVLKKLRKLSDRIKIIYISGNHCGPADIVSHLIGLDFVNEYIFESDNKKILVLHGDIFDNFISKYPVLTKWADRFYRLLQRFDRYRNNQYYYSNWAKRNSKTFLRCSEQIAERAIDYCRKKNCDMVIAGHTHTVLTKQRNGIQYNNSGCWTDQTCSYLTVNHGMIETHIYPTKN